MTRRQLLNPALSLRLLPPQDHQKAVSNLGTQASPSALTDYDHVMVSRVTFSSSCQSRILPKCTWITRSHTCTSSNRATSYIARDHYNVNSMLHLAENVKELGSLDKFSAFPFGNYLQHLEWVVRSTAISRSPCGMCLASLPERTTGWRGGTISSTVPSGTATPTPTS